MGQYSELIGSFKRMGNFPLEADYIFNSEEELKDFYSQEENAVLLHRGLFKIVADPNSNNQTLYWVNRKETNNDLELKKLLSFSDINSLESELTDLNNRLNQEIEDRKIADKAIWGTEDKTQVPDDLNSLFDLANAVIELKESIQSESERATEAEENLKSDIKCIVGTTSDNIQQYLESRLDYKSLTELSDTLNKFLNTVNSEDTSIDTFLELQNFLSGFEDTEVLKNVLDTLVSNIMGDPLPTEEFRTLRGIEDFVRILKSNSENTDSNLQSEIDTTQIGVGLNSDGSYSPDKETYYLKDATSVMNALKTLDSLVNEAINNCNLTGSKTNTVDTKVYKYKTETIVEANVLVSTEDGNSLVVKNDGLYHNIRSTYEDGVLTLYVNGNIVAQHILGLSYIGIDSAYYDPTTESLVFHFKKEDGTTDELRIPVHLLIREWITDNSGVSDTVVLTRIEDYNGGPDKVSADVRLYSDKYNILKKEGNTLYVKGTADNIVWNDVKVSILLDDLRYDVNQAKEALQNTDSNILVIKQDLQEKIDNEITRASNEEAKLKLIISNYIDSNNAAVEALRTSINQNTSNISNLTTKLNDEVTRATSSENTLNSKIVEEKLRAESAESDILSSVNKNTLEISKTQSDLEKESDRAKSEESSLLEKINTEISRASTKELELESLINLESERAKNAESILEQKIFIATDNSVKAVNTATKAYDKVLTIDNKVTTVANDLSNEITRATASEQILDHKISDVDTKLSTAVTSAEQALNVVNSHISNSSNPHNVTKYQIGLSLVENIAPIDMPLSNATKQAIEEALSWNE